MSADDSWVFDMHLFRAFRGVETTLAAPSAAGKTACDTTHEGMFLS